MYLTRPRVRPCARLHAHTAVAIAQSAASLRRAGPRATGNAHALRSSSDAGRPETHRDHQARPPRLLARSLRCPTLVSLLIEFHPPLKPRRRRCYSLQSPPHWTPSRPSVSMAVCGQPSPWRPLPPAAAPGLSTAAPEGPHLHRPLNLYLGTTVMSHQQYLMNQSRGSS